MPSSNKKVKLNVRVNKNKKKPVEERLAGDDFIEDFDQKVDQYVHRYEDKVERVKKITTVSGVAFFMILIVFIYSYNLRYQIKETAATNQKDEDISSKVEEIKSSVEEAFRGYREVRKTIEDQIDKGDSQSVASSSQSKATSSPESDRQDKILKLRDSLLEKSQ